MHARARRTIRLWAAVLATILTLDSASVSATETVSLRIMRAGDVSAFLVDGSLPANQAGFLDLVLRDRRGSATGWFISLGLEDGHSGFSLIRVHPPQVLSGQQVVAAGPHCDEMPGVGLDRPRQVLWADPGAGSGDYWQEMDAIRFSESTKVMVFVVTVGIAP
jgi:hypothetical protein